MKKFFYCLTELTQPQGKYNKCVTLVALWAIYIQQGINGQCNAPMVLLSQRIYNYTWKPNVVHSEHCFHIKIIPTESIHSRFHKPSFIS